MWPRHSGTPSATIRSQNPLSRPGRSSLASPWRTIQSRIAATSPTSPACLADGIASAPIAAAVRRLGPVSGIAELSFEASPGKTVSALFLRPPDARYLYVFGHGAGAGMQHRFMAAASAQLAERGIASLRYQFPYMEAGKGRPDHRGTLLATVRAAVGAAAKTAPDLPLL